MAEQEQTVQSSVHGLEEATKKSYRVTNLKQLLKAGQSLCRSVDKVEQDFVTICDFMNQVDFLSRPTASDLKLVKLALAGMGVSVQRLRNESLHGSFRTKVEDYE